MGGGARVVRGAAGEPDPARQPRHAGGGRPVQRRARALRDPDRAARRCFRRADDASVALAGGAPGVASPAYSPGADGFGRLGRETRAILGAVGADRIGTWETRWRERFRV